MITFFAQHRAALLDALRRLCATPFNTALSLLVIGIALALPSAGWVVLDNLRSITGSASGTQQVSIFMTLDAGKKDIAEIEARLRAVAGAGGVWSAAVGIGQTPMRFRRLRGSMYSFIDIDNRNRPMNRMTMAPTGAATHHQMPEISAEWELAQ